MEITKEDFESYEIVRLSGVTNMFAVNTVSDLSGLDRKQIMDIMQNYAKYAEKWPDVRNSGDLQEQADHLRIATGAEEDDDDYEDEDDDDEVEEAEEN